MKKRTLKFLIIISFILIILGILKIFYEKEMDEQTEIAVEKESSEIEKEVQKEKNENEIFGEMVSVSNEPVFKINEKNIKIPILIYHAFQTPVPEDDTYKLFSTGARFEENVVSLLEEGYTFITLEELYQYKNGEIGLPEKVVVLTMDDGWLGCYTEAFPVLQKYHIPATIFIIKELVGTPGYFSWEQAKEMYQTGLVKIHCHGKSHIDYTTVSKSKLIADYNETHAKIEEVMGEKIQKIMAYPSGKCTENTKKWLKEAGFEVQVLTKYGTVNQSNTLDLTSLGRIRGEQATGKELLMAID